MSCVFSMSPGVFCVLRFLPLFLSLPKNPTYTSCLAIGPSAFYYTNHNNTSSHSAQISHNTPLSLPRLFENQRQSKPFPCMIPVRVELLQEEANLCGTWPTKSLALPAELELVLGLEGQRLDSSSKSLPCPCPPPG